jgi:hypothetical protein
MPAKTKNARAHEFLRMQLLQPDDADVLAGRNGAARGSARTIPDLPAVATTSRRQTVGSGSAELLAYL